jgi:pilus assembly protein CpaE
VPNLTRIAKIDDIVQHSQPAPSELSYVLVVGPSNNEDYLEPLATLAQRHRDRFFFILISEEISASSYKRLMRTEGADWASAAGAPHEVVEIFARRRTARPVAERKEPVTIAFVPAAGGVGNTTLVTELGTQLKSQKALRSSSICIVDLDFQTSHLCDHLDIEARLQIHEILDDPQRLDAQLLDLFISRHASGLDVLAAPRSKFNVSDVDVATLDALFHMMAQRYDWILIDLPVTWFSWTQEVIANSTGVIVTGINTIPCLRQISESVAVIRTSRPHPGPVAIVINRCEHGLLGGVSRRKHVKSVLGDETIYFVQDDKKAMVESVNMGVPISLSANRRVVKQIAAIASYCTAIQPGTQLIPVAPVKAPK